MDEISRRAAARAIAWTAPAIAVAATVPRAAASVPDLSAPSAEGVMLCCDPGYLELSVSNPPTALAPIILRGWRDASGRDWWLEAPQFLDPNTSMRIAFLEPADCDAPTGWVVWSPWPSGAFQYIPVDLSGLVNEGCSVE